MDENVNVSPNQANVSGVTMKIILILTAVVILIIVFLVAYYLGLNQVKTIAPNKSNEISKNIIFPTSSPSEIQWVKFSQDLGKVVNYTTWHVASYTVEYPSDSDVTVYDGNTIGWPLANMDLLLNRAVLINSNTKSKIDYQIAIGESDVDPSTCYKTTCLGAFKSIDSIEDIEVASISGKLIRAKADNGGGVLMPTPQTVKTVVLPFNSKFLILHTVSWSASDPFEMFDSIVKKFTLTLN